MPRTWAPGTIFAGYRIERVVGSGGMGTVYLVAHPRLPRFDALKVLPDLRGSDPEFRARFIREAELAARLDHPNIVAVRDRGVEGEYLWIAMQFVDGVDATELLRRNPGGLPPVSALHILTEAAHGLDEAHRAGLLHRDVKPGNILIESRVAGPDRVYVTDFGIARAAAETTNLTEAGSVLATLAYAAPEQIMAAPNIDHRVDVYALGCTLYELLTGSKPFPRATAAMVMQAHLHDPPPRVTAHAPTLPAAIDDVIARALAKDPTQRYPTCGALAQAAAAAFAGANAPSMPSMPSPRRRRIGPVLAVVAVLALLAAASVIALNWKSRQTVTATTTPSPATSAPVSSGSPTSKPTTSTSGTGPVGWGQYGFMVTALPTLLPATPVSSGYQGIRCVPVDRDLRQVDISAQVGRSTRMTCTGNQNPLRLLYVTCNVSRSPTYVRPFTDLAVVGDEQWERSSGKGRLVWGEGPYDGGVEGTLQIQFDDPARNFCQLDIHGGTSGQELVDRWWRDAPL